MAGHNACPLNAVLLPCIPPRHRIKPPWAICNPSERLGPQSRPVRTLTVAGVRTGERRLLPPDSSLRVRMVHRKKPRETLRSRGTWRFLFGNPAEAQTIFASFPGPVFSARGLLGTIVEHSGFRGWSRGTCPWQVRLSFLTAPFVQVLEDQSGRETVVPSFSGFPFLTEPPLVSARSSSFVGHLVAREAGLFVFVFLCLCV